MHIVLVTAAVIGSERAASRLGADVAPPQMVRLLNRAPRETVRAERTTWISLPVSVGPGAGGGLGSASPGGTLTPSDTQPSAALTHEPQAAPSQDSVFTEYEVDSAATAIAGSPGPVFPPDLLLKRIGGSVLAQYVVDTTGWADTATVAILRSSHQLFDAAVREALRQMRFRPARIGRLPVRQAVQQEFIFRINADTLGVP